MILFLIININNIVEPWSRNNAYVIFWNEIKYLDGQTDEKLDFDG